jgi:hypothetical protein
MQRSQFANRSISYYRSLSISRDPGARIAADEPAKVLVCTAWAAAASEAATRITTSEIAPRQSRGLLTGAILPDLYFSQYASSARRT